VPRRRDDAADGDADSWESAAGQRGQHDGADVSRHAGVEREQQWDIGGNGELHKPGGDGGVVGWSDLYDDYFGLCGFVDCTGGIARADGDTDGSDGGGEYEYDTSCDYGICAGAGFFDFAEYGWDGGCGDIEYFCAGGSCASYGYVAGSTCESGADRDANGSDGDSGRQLDEDCDYGICAIGDLSGMVVCSGGYYLGHPELQLDCAGRNHRDRV